MKLSIFTLLILVSITSTYSQDFVNPIKPKPMSEELHKYLALVTDYEPEQSRSLHNTDPKKMKQILAYGLFSQIFNPYEYNKRYELYGNDGELYFPDSYFVVDIKKMNSFDFKYQKYLMHDIFLAPFIFAGKITEIDTLARRRGFDIIRYEAEITYNFNKFYNKDIVGKKIEFRFSTGLWTGYFGSVHNQPIDSTIRALVPENMRTRIFEIAKNYESIKKDKTFLFSLEPNPNQYKTLKGVFNRIIPVLFINIFGIEKFEIKDGFVIDEHGYFGKSKKVPIPEVKLLYSNILDEIHNWR